MNQDVLISVIVPVYNVESYLVRCVDSIRNQTYQKLEIILVDDGSKDGSGRLCDDLAFQDERIRVIHKENGGLSSARNAGIDIAEGAYLQFVDSDDWLEPDASAGMLACALENHTEMVCAGRYDVDEDTGKKTRGLCPEKREVISGMEMAGRIFLWDNCDSSACDKLFHRKLFRQIRFPLGVVSEDIPVMYRIALDAGRVAMYDKPVYNYFQRSGSITSGRLSEKTFHYVNHTAKIYEDICENVPQIEKQARYLRVRSLVRCVQLADLADGETANTFQQQISLLRKELRSHMGFILKSPFFTRKERRVDVLLALNLYKSLRVIRNRLR